MKKNNIRNIVLVIIFILVISIIVRNKNNYFNTTIIKEETNSNLDNNMVAVFIKDDTEYEKGQTIPTEGYLLNEEKSYCGLENESGEIPKDNTIILNYHDGVMGFDNITKKDTKCYLYFDKIKGTTSLTIIANSNYKTTTPTFTNAATTDEGVYRTEDGMYGGYSYYWRGAATTNHVIFANFCWRIVRINGDGSTRLIFNGPSSSDNTCKNNAGSSSIVAPELGYNSSANRSEYVGYTYEIGNQRITGGTPSNLKSETDNWFNANITGSNLNNVADGKFCNDRNVEAGTTWDSQPGASFNYATYNRVNEANPTLSCPDGDIYILKVGAITIDEVMYAGGTSSGNSSYYLYNGKDYWTMTPRGYYEFWTNFFVSYVYSVGLSGSISSATVYNNSAYDTFRSARPVINLKPETQFNVGSDGTQSNPYIVK